MRNIAEDPMICLVDILRVFESSLPVIAEDGRSLTLSGFLPLVV